MQYYRANNYSDTEEEDDHFDIKKPEEEYVRKGTLELSKFPADIIFSILQYLDYNFVIHNILLICKSFNNRFSCICNQR